jgi:hypothetical protein
MEEVSDVYVELISLISYYLICQDSASLSNWNYWQYRILLIV